MKSFISIILTLALPQCCPRVTDLDRSPPIQIGHEKAHKRFIVRHSHFIGLKNRRQNHRISS